MGKLRNTSIIGDGDTKLENNAGVTDDGALVVSIGGGTGAVATGETDPLNAQFNNSLIDVDTVNLVAGTHYFPSAAGVLIDFYKSLDIGGKLISSDGSVTLTLEACNDSLGTNFNEMVMVDTSVAGAGATVNEVTVGIATLPLSLTMKDLNKRLCRVKIEVVGVANTVQLNGRTVAI